MRAGGSDDQHVVHTEVERGAGCRPGVGVAGRHDDEGAPPRGIVDGGLEGPVQGGGVVDRRREASAHGDHRAVERGKRFAERIGAHRQVDDFGSLVGGEPDALRDVVNRASSVAADGLDRQDPGVGGNAGHALTVVRSGGDDAGHPGAVALVVSGPVGGARVGPGAVATAVVGARRLRGRQVADAELHTGVDDGNRDPGPRAGGPGLRGLDDLQGPLTGEVAVVRRVGDGGKGGSREHHHPDGDHQRAAGDGGHPRSNPCSGRGCAPGARAAPPADRTIYER